VLGQPIAHSKSPLLHQTAYHAMGLDWEYSRCEVNAQGLPAFLDSLDESWRGLSLTMPLKRVVLDHVAEIDPLARLTGTANTVLLPSGGRGRRAFNTDVPGFRRALTAAGVVGPHTVLILGSGATAACALCAAAQAGADEVTIAARNPGHAQWLEPMAQKLGIPLTVCPIELADRTVTVPEVVISTLPGGTVLDMSFAASTRRTALLFDVSYDPWPSSLARAWQDVGGAILSGLTLLVHQALVQVRVFVHGDPEAVLADEMRILDAMLAAVGLDRAGRALPRA
jgi:shikimate dehydrogenase